MNNKHTDDVVNDKIDKEVIDNCANINKDEVNELESELNKMATKKNKVCTVKSSKGNPYFR
ncbi:MAG: hypothetical protein ACEY3E_06840 [Candidatus Tisiphia sp.]